MTETQPWLHRLEAESIDTDLKLSSLNQFINHSPDFRTLGWHAKGLIIDQREVMTRLSDILKARIAEAKRTTPS